MKLKIFKQWDKLVAQFKSIAAASAESAIPLSITRLEASDGGVTLIDHAVNLLAVSDESVTVTVPDIDPGKTRSFVLRVTATGTCTLAFTGAEAFEGESGALDPPGDGETVLYFFMETEGDIFWVERKVANVLGGD